MMKDQKHQNQGTEKERDLICFEIYICSFEEEQQELQKSLSKDWCDKMDNEEAEEKKLHR